MRAGVLYDERKIEVREVEDPTPRAGEVIVESSFGGICGTDVHIYRGEFRGRVRYPAIQGHEFGGVIAEIGPGVTGWSRGDRVAVDPILPCHACPACLRGQLSCCRTLRLLGVDDAGGFGRLVAVPTSCATARARRTPWCAISSRSVWRWPAASGPIGPSTSPERTLSPPLSRRPEERASTA
jgi:threonine dehydrogenase-like Zn-dependent dehydrogenase